MNHHPSAFQFAFPPGLPAVSLTTPNVNRVQEVQTNRTPGTFVNSRDFNELDVSEFANKYAKKTTVSGQVTANELYRVFDRQTVSRIQPFVEVTNLCYMRLKKLAQSGLTACYFEVPRFVAGLPLFDTAACTEFIACHLKSNGFSVDRTSDRMLLVSWVNVERLREVKDRDDVIIRPTVPEILHKVPCKHKVNIKPKNNDLKITTPYIPLNVNNVNNVKLGKSPTPTGKSPVGKSPVGKSPTMHEDATLFKSIALLRPSGRFSLNLD